MLSVAIKGPTFEEAEKQIAQAALHADLIELRLDLFTSFNIAALQKLRSTISMPMICTLRSRQQGGEYRQSENERIDTLRQIAALRPEYLDLESHIAADLIIDIHESYPEIKLIISNHNFLDTPQNLQQIYDEMCQAPAWAYKIVTTAQSAADPLRMLIWAKNIPNIIPICMGTHGEISRVLAPWVGAPFTYACLEDGQETATGQLSAKTLVEQYRYRSMTPETKLYGLIGHPVSKSISGETHNAVFQAFGIDAIYVKMDVEESALKQFMLLAKQLPFHGLSVTMPLKELLLDDMVGLTPPCSDIKAVNTVSWIDDRWIGNNTDGIGALNAIERAEPVRGKRVVLIGAGGAAKAIAYESVRRGAQLTIVNRHVAKAEDLACTLQATALKIDDMHRLALEGYDILINATPVDMPIHEADILEGALAMDIRTIPKETAFLSAARRKSCRIIYGYQMFVEQAIGQFQLWFKETIPIETCRELLEKETLKRLRNIKD